MDIFRDAPHQLLQETGILGGNVNLNIAVGILIFSPLPPPQPEVCTNPGTYQKNYITSEMMSSLFPGLLNSFLEEYHQLIG